MKGDLREVGSPDRVSSQESDSLTDDDRLFEHGKTGSQGGDRGNEYQALWMTLACLNATFATPNEPQLVEIILEGKTEPYDDVELRKNDNSFTLFQSKHRDTSSSDNITISELLKMPPKKGGKSTNTAFSLPKYFMGMMKEHQKSGEINKKRFVICTSAPFSTRFKNPDDNKTVSLEASTWGTNGILQDLSKEQLDPLFTGIFVKRQKYFSLTQLTNKSKPEYARLTDNFINGVNITSNQKILRDLIFKNIKAFIIREKKAGWVINDMQQNPDKYIKFFLQNLQWWIKQPKLEELRDHVVKYCISENFGGSVQTIHREFYEIMRTSSSRDTKSLDLNDIEKHLRAARGTALSTTLSNNAERFHEQHLLATVPCQATSKSVKKFLNDDSLKAFIIYSDQCLGELKYVVYRTLSNSDQCGKVFQSWCIVDAMKKPIYHQHVARGLVDYDIGDIFLAKTFDIIILDNVDALLKVKNGKQRLKQFFDQSTTRTIIIVSQKNKAAVKTIFNSKTSSAKRANVTLTNNDIEACLSSQEVRKKSLVLQSTKTSQPTFDIIEKIPSVLFALKSPSTLADFLNTLAPRSTRVTPSVSLAQFEVSHYFETPLRLPLPYYDLHVLFEHTLCEKICVKNLSSDTQKMLREEFQEKCKITTSKNKKHLFFQLEGEKEQSTLFVKHKPKLGQFAVIPVTLDETALDRLPNIPATGFRQNKSSTLEEHASLLTNTRFGVRSLIVANYGTGKSSLIKQLYLKWARLDFNPKYFDFVIPIHLTKIVPLVNKEEPLINILVLELQRQGLLPKKPPYWLLKSLYIAIETGNVLILFDRWDELHEQYYETMNTWLSALPEQLSFVVASQTHALPALKLRFHQKIELPLFKWTQIKKYISLYVKDLLCQDVEKAKKLLSTITQWLGNGTNEEVNSMLSRPLHLRLLCDALESHITETTDEDPPWLDPDLYRIKLYQLIMHEQFRRYIVNHLQASELTHASQTQGVNLFTQAHQARLRDLGFELIFEQQAIRLITAIDEKALLTELYNIGILTNTDNGNERPEFLYRIFAVYFSAQYLLNGLLRGKGDFIYNFVIDTIRENAANPRFEEVWRLLGEMLRNGEMMLNFNPDTHNRTRQSTIKEIQGSDCCGTYYSFLETCFSGTAQSNVLPYHMLIDEDFYHQGQAFTRRKQKEDEAYTNLTLKDLLGTARGNKNSAQGVVSHLIATGQLTENWLCYFYYQTENAIARANEEQLSNPDFTRTLQKLKQLVETFKWPEAGWGGYWDIDAFLPCIELMNTHLFIYGAAYFIHRIENRGGKHYDYGLTSAAGEIIEQLANGKFDDIDSIRFFLMMLLSWLRKPALQHNCIAYIIPGTFKKIFTLIESENESDQLLSICALYCLSYRYTIRVELNYQEDSCQITLRTVNKGYVFQYQVPEELAKLLEKQFKALKLKMIIPQLGLPRFELDGSDFVTPASHKASSHENDESSEETLAC